MVLFLPPNMKHDVCRNKTSFRTIYVVVSSMILAHTKENDHV